MASRSNRSSAKMRNIFILVGIALVAGLGWYVATSSDLFQSQASPATRVANRRPSRSYETATVVTTRNVGSFLNTIEDRYNALLDDFNLATWQTSSGRLNVRITLPTKNLNPGNSFEPHWFSYSTARRSAECPDTAQGVISGSLGDIYRTSTFENIQIPLNVWDYGRHYCFKVGIMLRGSDLRTWRIFSSPPIELAGLPVTVPAPTNYQRAVHADTDYDWGVLRAGLGLGGPTEVTRTYYQHLDANFDLFTRQTADDVLVRVRVPGHFARPRARDINSFTIEQIDYAFINRDRCRRNLFETTGQRLANSVNFTLPNHPRGSATWGYCIRVQLQGEISWSPDVHPARIFFVSL